MGALALVLPVSALVSFTGEPDRDVRLTATGPAPTRAGAPRPDVGVPGTGAGASAPTIPFEPGAAGAALDPGSEVPSPTTTPEAQLRVTGAHGRTEPASPTSRVPADDPVVRVPASSPSTSAPPSGGQARSASGAPSTTVSPSPDPQAAACPTDGVRVVVATEQSGYGPGQTVRWTSTLENRSASACLLPTRAFFRVEDAAGKVVGSFAATADYRMPVKAEPGKVFPSSLSWDQKDCSGPACVQVPAGAYVVVADWTEGVSYTARASFQIGA